MAYHPLYDGLWQHPALEGAPFEEKGFLVFLWSNPRIRPSGIYRVTDAQLAVDTALPLTRVRRYLTDLVSRLRIVRDGAWLFIRGYLKRQPNQPFLMRGVERDVTTCSSVAVLEAFSEKYPLLKQWSVNRLATIGATVDQPLPQPYSVEPTTTPGGFAVSDSLALSDSEKRGGAVGLRRSAPSPPRDPASPATRIQFEIPPSIQHALSRAPILGAVPRLQHPVWWQAQVRAHGRRGVDFAAELLNAEAWLTSNPTRAPRKDHPGFLHRWFKRAGTADA